MLLIVNLNIYHFFTRAQAQIAMNCNMPIKTMIYDIPKKQGIFYNTWKGNFTFQSVICIGTW